MPLRKSAVTGNTYELHEPKIILDGNHQYWLSQRVDLRKVHTICDVQSENKARHWVHYLVTQRITGPGEDERHSLDCGCADRHRKVASLGYCKHIQAYIDACIAFKEQSYQQRMAAREGREPVVAGTTYTPPNLGLI